MNERPSQPPFDPSQPEMLEMYLDGALAGDAKMRFEEALAREPALRAAVDRQGAIDSSLRRTFAAPVVSEAFIARLVASQNGKFAKGDLRIDREESQAAVSRPRSKPVVRRPLLIAASIVFVFLGPLAAWMIWTSMP